MKRIACVGVGTVGRSWGIVFARAGLSVRLFDADAATCDRVIGEIARALAVLVDEGGLDDAAAVMARITLAASLADAVTDADYVQESIAEDAALKTELFAALDRLAPATAILASSTSAIPISAFVGGLAGAGRCLVAHPFNPPHLLPLVELVPGPATDPDTVARARALMQQVGQKPVTVHAEIAGFVGNRLQVAVATEALHLVAAGVISPDDLDTCLRWGLGQRWALMGPFETMDLNAVDGFAGYVRRLGPGFSALAEQLHANRPWPATGVAPVVAARRAALPLDGIDARRDWRDRMLVRLRRMAEEDGG